MSVSADSKSFTGELRRPPWSYKVLMLARSRERFFDQLIDEFGDFVHYRGPINFYLVNHPSLVKQVLQGTNDTFDKNSPLYDRFRQAFGNGLVVAEGSNWKRRRGAIQQLMGQRAIKAYFDGMVSQAQEVVRLWKPRAESQSLFDIAIEMDQLTLSIIGRTLFHDRFDEAKDSIRHWTKVIDHFSSKPPLPIVRSAWFPSPLNYRLKATLRDFHAFIQSMIDDARQAETNSGLLQLLCKVDLETDQRPLTDEEIRDEVLGMIIGGHETSSVALTWIWYELSKNPEVEQRLHQELDTVLGDRPLTPESVSQLKYTRMVIDETLRLHPPFWFENRNVVRSVELGGVPLPAGSMVAFSRYAVHRHPDFWSEPDVFRPERFEPGKEENTRSTHAYLPFGGGPRVCVGLHFAIQELVVLLATLARAYRVQVAEGQRHEVSALLTMRLRRGLRVSVTQR